MRKLLWLALAASFLPSVAQAQTFAQKWAGVKVSLQSEEQSIASCSAGRTPCSAAMSKFLSLVALAHSQNLTAFNRAVNIAVMPVSDLKHWGKADVWSAPLVTLAEKKGDCEDYAILKIAILRAVGKQGRLVVVKNGTEAERHAVAEVWEGGQWLVLDNTFDVALPLEKIKGYQRLFTSS